MITHPDTGQTLSGARVSIIIPCFNAGAYLKEAVASAQAQTHSNCELIVVDDGSTDSVTLRVLDSLDAPPLVILRQTNQGLAAARNAGIGASTGEYILPLDADDKIGRSYAEQAASVLDANSSVGIVYCEARYFGDQEGPWELPPFRLQSFLLTNSIFCSAMFRRDDWKAVGGYKLNMRYGHEDHDFWLSLIELGRGVHRIPETLFFYRRRSGSMYAGITDDQKIYSYAQLVRNHRKLYWRHRGHVVREIVGRGVQKPRLKKALQVIQLLLRDGLGLWARNGRR